MLIDILLIYLFATLNLPTWFLTIVIADLIIRTFAMCLKNIKK